jgi:uncharacterized protein
MKRTLTALALGFSLLAASGGFGYAQDFEKAFEAASRGDYATALREWSALAEQGHAKAQYKLGLMYFYGMGVVQDYKEAVKWYRKAAEQGDAVAQGNLGWMYIEGQGVTQDYKEAVRWRRKAAEQGNALEQYNLGTMYGNGHGVIQDNVYAHMWFNIAASNGDAKATKGRDIVAKQMTVADISKAQELAQACVDKNYKGC